MNPLSQILLTGVLSSLLSASIAAFVAARIVPKHYYRQRWWERQAEAYSQTVAQLSKLQFYLSEWIDHATGVRAIQEADRARLGAEFRELRHSLNTVAAGGEFIMSQPAVDALRKVVRVLDDDQSGDWVGDMERQYEAVKTAIETLREQARKELRPR